MFSLLIVYDAGRKVQYISSEKSIASMLVQNYHALSKQKKDLILDIVGDVHCKLYCLNPVLPLHICPFSDLQTLQKIQIFNELIFSLIMLWLTKF